MRWAQLPSGCHRLNVIQFAHVKLRTKKTAAKPLPVLALEGVNFKALENVKPPFQLIFQNYCPNGYMHVYCVHTLQAFHVDTRPLVHYCKQLSNADLCRLTNLTSLCLQSFGCNVSAPMCAWQHFSTCTCNAGSQLLLHAAVCLPTHQLSLTELTLSQ